MTICPWWDGPIGRAALVERLAADATRGARRWVWVYHWPPRGSLTSWTGRHDYGDADLRGWIEEYRPDVVLTGHIHEAPFKPDGSWADRIGSTWVFNAGHQIRLIPAHIELDFIENTAKWVSLLGTEKFAFRWRRPRSGLCSNWDAVPARCRERPPCPCHEYPRVGSVHF